MIEIRNEKGELHNLDGPAIIEGDYKAWCINGKLHRLDGPAVINGDNIEEWHINGKKHRKAGDGPAIIKGIYKAWYINGELHNLDGPAVIDGYYKAWYKNNKRHREDGPAIIDDGYYKLWFINNIEKDKKWVVKYLKIKNNHLINGVIVSDKWKIREIILRWRYNPKLKCVKNRLEREYNSLYN